MTSPKDQIEALLFSSGKAMTENQLAELAKLDKAKVRRALKALQKDYRQREGAVHVVQDNDTWKMHVTNEHLPLVRNIVADTELSRACLETLAVIAYKYPSILQSEVIDTRGSGAYEHIGELEKLGFVNKEKSGRSFKLKLAEKFFEYFDIEGEKDIKKAFKDIKLPSKEEQKKLGGMDVVDVDPEKEKGPMGDMEVVPVSEQPEQPDIPQQENAVPEEKQESHSEFLSDLDARIENISKKNDENEQDPLLQRQRLEEEEPLEQPPEEQPKDETEEKP